MNDRDAIKSRSVLTLKSILFLLCYTASQNIFDYAKLMINIIYLMYIHTFISVILVIASKIGCDRDDDHQFTDDETFVT